MDIVTKLQDQVHYSFIVKVFSRAYQTFFVVNFIYVQIISCTVT